jgi:fatty-acyl-CoA synthase
MAGLVLAPGVTFDGAAFGRWLDGQDAIGPKWRPRYVRILRAPPTTGTNKILKRTLQHHRWRSSALRDEVWVRVARNRLSAVHPEDERALYEPS